MANWSGIAGVDWAADGKSLYVGVYRGILYFGHLQTWALLKIALDGTITTLAENGDVRFSYAIPSPDGHRLALGGATLNSNVWVLENF